MSLITRTDVTAVKLHQSFIVVGLGSYIEVYQRDSGKFVQKIRALRGQKVHSIVPYSSLNSKLLIFGGKQFTVLVTDNEAIKSDENLQMVHHVDPVVCNDWLLSGIWMYETEIAFLTAHNVVQIWNIDKLSLTKQYVNPDNSILYSGLLHPVLDELLVFCGTVFSEVIVLWTGDEQPLHYLKGHKGVIFSITYDPIKAMIVTTSDDRSLRIWSIQSLPSLEYTSKKYWQNAGIVSTHELYGHSARVMRNCIISDYIISIGEDSGICYWDFKGKLVRKVVSHQNACIWSLDANEKYLVTGGGDSSVIVHPLSMLTDYCNRSTLTINAGSIKKIEFTARGNLVIINENDLIYFDLKSKKREVYNLNHKSTYKFLSLSTCRQIIAVIDMTGKLDVFIENCKGDVEINNIMNKQLNLGNILSMHWGNNRCLVVCSDNGYIKVIASKERDIEVIADFILPPCKERWLTSSTLSENNKMLVVSDRNGHIHVYSPGNKYPFKTFDRVHGRYGATSIKLSNNEIVTTGRDGTIKYFSVDKKTNDIKYLYSRDLEFQWVENFLDKNRSYICGFQERVFVVYDIKNGIKILEANCGGGHRSWDSIRYFEEVNENFEEFIRLIYLKNSEIHMETFQLSKIVSRKIVNGTHSKEINCLKTCVVPKDSDSIYFISGGEDTTLRISKSCTDTKFRDEIIFKQLSSIRCLKMLSLEANNILLVSAGGRAQICAKKLTLNDGKITSEELMDYLIKGTDKERKGNRNWKDCSIDFDPETRIMDVDILKIEVNTFLITAGCSDGILRVFKLESNFPVEFKLVKEIRHHKTCILKTFIFKVNNKNVLATATTRGNVAFWDIKNTFTDFDIIFEMKTNKSGINSVDVKIMTETKFLLATGGDDNAIHLNVLEFTDKAMTITNKWTSDKYHCSQITGLKLIDNLMLTTSIDQRITLFKLAIKDEINCEFMSQTFSDVADIQGMDVIGFSKDLIKVCVFGKGLEVLEISCNRNMKS